MENLKDTSNCSNVKSDVFNIDSLQNGIDTIIDQLDFKNIYYKGI